MNERREPTISPLSADGAEPEKRRATAAHPERSHSAPPPVSSRPVVVRSSAAPFALVLALLSLGFGGFMYWQGMEASTKLNSTQQTLETALGRITELEQRLMLSDDESTQSITVIQAKVKENASEVRKLWAVAYDKNRTAIAKLDKESKALKKTLSSTDSRLQKSIKDVSTELQILNEIAQGQQTVIAKADQWMGQQKSSMDSVLSRVDTLDTQLNRRLKENEEAIKSIDAFRVQINREMIKLKGG